MPAIDRGFRAQDIPGDPARRAAAPAPIDRASAASATYLPDSVIVKFKDGADRSAAVNSTLSQVSGGAAERPSSADFDLITLGPGVDPEAAAAALAARGDVEYAQPRYRAHAMTTPNDPLYSRQWHFPAIDMERAWDINPGATSEVVVAVLDGGVAYRDVTIRYTADAFQLEPGGPTYPALGSVEVPFAAAPELGPSSRFVAPRDFIWNDTLPVDLDGHGTHVAGTIGQVTNNGVGVAGMAYNVRIMPVKVISETWDDIFESPNIGTDDVVARGIRYAADNGAHVINLSIGRTAGGAAPAVEAAIRYAIGRGAFVAVAAGNTRATGNQQNRYAEFAPAIDGLIAVGAVGRDLAVAYYSTTGPSVEIAAPGGDQLRGGGDAGVLQQTVDLDLALTYEAGPARFGPPRFDAFRYYFFQGTSMATPHVSGLAAMLRQQGLTGPAAIEAAMKQFARDLGTAGRDNDYGYGLISPRATLRGLGLAR